MGSSMRFQPQALARVNLAHPIARGLVGFWLPNGGIFKSAIPGIRDAVVSTGGAFSFLPKGRVLAASASGVQAGYIARDSRWQPVGAITIIAEGVVVGSSSNGLNYWFGNEDATGGFGVYGNGSDNTATPYLKVGAAFAGGSSGVPLGTAAQIGMTYDGATFYVTRNGVRVFNQAITGTITNAATDLALTAKSNGDNNKGSGSFYYLAIWNRALSAAELASFYANPWQIFDAPEDEDFLVAASVPISPTNSTGTFAATLASPSMASVGAVVAVGTLAANMAAPTFAASGVAATPPSGTFAASMPAPAMTSTGIALDAGQFSATMPAPTMAAIGTAAPNVTGTLAFTMPAPTMNAFGFLGANAPAAPVKPYRWRILRRGFAPS